MTTRTISGTQKQAGITTGSWLRTGLQAGLAAVLVVLLTQAVILSLWPELASFKPLESYPRSALFTFIPALAATAIFARLVKTQERPIRTFLWISAAALLLSFIPDYVLPIPNRTLVASSAAAFLHLLAGIVTGGLILVGYARSSMGGRKDT
jgi:hypothetical protein